MTFRTIAPALLLSLVSLSAVAGPSKTFEVLQLTRSNPYGLSTEKAFGVDYARTIWPWFLQSRPGVFTGARGVKLHYRVFLQNDRATEKGAIVISSGRTEGLIIYPELLHDLWKQGYSIYIHDHRGQGFSGGRIGGNSRGDVEAFGDFVADLKTFVDTVVRPGQHRKLFLVAHSMGGGIASLFLERYPDVFNAAVLVSPMHDPLLPGPWTGKDRTAVICGLGVIFQGVMNPSEYAIGQKDYARLKFGEQTDLTHSEVRWNHTRDIYDDYQGARVGGPTHRWIREACAAAETARDDAAKVTVPVLLLQAGDDVVVRNESQKEFCDEAPRCVGVIVPGARHALFIERDDFRLPLLNRTIEFLDAQSKR
jgi:lysophospholipase